VFISPLKDTKIPDLDALYIGGGFPETQAEKLAGNRGFLNALKNLAMAGLPIYAECGGLMFLGEEMVIDGVSYKMSAILPLTFGLFQKPQGHGYTKIIVKKENPFFKVGTILRGHEFHYSKVLKWNAGSGAELVFSMERGTGLIDKKDGVCMKNVFATYSHIHALGTPDWAKAVVRNANYYKIEAGR
ncbi:MAG TPA: cobyrinic acid a,c-diamide synthase, partial [Desulfobacteraceae bacterium]|nr:cobyrinic acid a,c-diamide synthase [Desulfobacteraceae bacterium]